MKIETFNQLFQAKYPGGKATVNGRGAVGNYKCAISLTYSRGGKVYEYRNTILGLAEQLRLIPLIDCNAEARRVIAELGASEHAIAPIAAVDTVRFHAPWPVEYEHAGEDAYGRRLAQYWKI